MANIINVGYKQIPGIIQQMLLQGTELNGKILTVRQKIVEMHNCWYGKRYNALLMEFNKIFPQMDEMLLIVQFSIPNALQNVANNYSLADEGVKVSNIGMGAPSKIPVLDIPNDEDMRFISSEVSNIQSDVSKLFGDAEQIMNAIESTYATTPWQSEAAERFKARFKKLKSEIVTSIENLKSQFVTLMNETEQDIQNTENANTVQ